MKQILAIHDHACTSCTRTGNCELQTLLRRYHIQEPDGSGRLREEIDRRSIIVRDYNKCIRCRRCVAACEGIQGIGAIRAVGEGLGAVIEPVSEAGLSATKCVNCGQCISVCPVGALTERDNTGELLAALRDPKKFVLVQAAPAVRAALGEEFGFPVGVDVEGRLAAALRELGFDRVFDTKFGADLTIMEETGEFLERLQSGGVLPMMTSCCPGWIKFCEHEFPDMPRPPLLLQIASADVWRGGQILVRGTAGDGQRGHRRGQRDAVYRQKIRAGPRGRKRRGGARCGHLHHHPGAGPHVKNRPKSSWRPCPMRTLTGRWAWAPARA